MITPQRVPDAVGFGPDTHQETSDRIKRLIPAERHVLWWIAQHADLLTTPSGGPHLLVPVTDEVLNALASVEAELEDDEFDLCDELDDFAEDDDPDDFNGDEDDFSDNTYAGAGSDWLTEQRDAKAKQTSTNAPRELTHA